MPRDQQSRVSRRKVLAQLFTGAGAALLAGCEAASRTQWFPKILGVGEHLTRSAQHLLTSRRSMAQEFEEADLSPQFRSNGTSNPKSPAYQAHARNGFADWALQVDGLVASPATLSLAQLRAMPSRTQITRHDCVEGWSAIGKWKGVPLGLLLERAGPLPNARYVVFRCADAMESGTADSRYYESVDMDDAYHVQTLLAYELNDAPLPVENGAPLRARIERQLGYKHAKYVMQIELVESFENIRGGKGGYWEDEGYE